MDDQPVSGRRGLLKALAVGVPGAAWAPKTLAAPDHPAPVSYTHLTLPTSDLV